MRIPFIRPDGARERRHPCPRGHQPTLLAGKDAGAPGHGAKHVRWFNTPALLHSVTPSLLGFGIWFFPFSSTCHGLLWYSSFHVLCGLRRGIALGRSVLP